jgi:ribosome-associated protein
MAKRFKSLAIETAKAASDKKGDDIILLHVGKKSPIADYLLIVTANSRPHLEVLEDSIKTRAKDLGFLCIHRARPASDQWRVLDFGGIIAHIMTQEARAFYALEKIFPNSPAVEWERESGGAFS